MIFQLIFLTKLIFIIYFISGYFGFITGFRGSQKLKVGNYTFTRNKTNGTKTYWSCARAGLHKCKARVVTIRNGDMQSVLVKCAIHNHDPF